MAGTAATQQITFNSNFDALPSTEKPRWEQLEYALHTNSYGKLDEASVSPLPSDLSIAIEVLCAEHLKQESDARRAGTERRARGTLVAKRYQVHSGW